MKVITTLSALLLSLCPLPDLFGQCKLDYSNYELVLDEQFDTYGGSTANLLGPSSIWKATFECPLSGWGVEYFDQSQVSLIPDGTGGSRLRLTAERLPVPINAVGNPAASCRASGYTTAAGGKQILFKSGLLTLKDAAALPPSSLPIFDNTLSCPPVPGNMRGWSYGIFEIRCKTPAGSSTGVDPERWDTWPAFWLIGHGELDMIDAIGSNPGVFTSMGKIDWTRFPESNPSDWDRLTTSCPTCPPFDGTKSYLPGDLVLYNPGSSTVYRAKRPLAPVSYSMKVNATKRNLSNEFTTYTAVWTPDKITFFLEGREVYTLTGDQAKLGNGCPLNMLVDLQMHPSAVDPDVPFSRIYQMDIDYIRVYKPGQGNYNVAYKSTANSLHHDVFAGMATAPVNVSSKPGSIAVNTSNADEVFYRGTDDYLYVANRVSGNWSVKKLEFNDGIPIKATGDIKYVPNHDLLIYAGSNNRINLFGRSATEPCGFYHWYLSSNWSCWWCITDDYIKNTAGTLQVTSNGVVYFAGTDDKLHKYYYDEGLANWQHANFGTPFTPVAGVQGDIIVDEATAAIYYKGLNNKIYSYWTTGTSYFGAEIPPGGTPAAFEAKATANSMVWAPSMNRIMYIGSDNKIQQYQLISSVWTHSWIPYSYTAAPDGYTNGELARANIGWDDYKQRVHYGGFDGRLQLFGYDGTGWWHWSTDDYWNTNAYKTFNSTSGSAMPSITLGPESPEKSIYYTQADNHLAYFRHEPCEYLVTESHSEKDMNKTKPIQAAPVLDLPIVNISPNPSSGLVYIKATQSVNLSVMDITGRAIRSYQNVEKLDISDLPAGVYLFRITDKEDHLVTVERVIKSN